MIVVNPSLIVSLMRDSGMLPPLILPERPISPKHATLCDILISDRVEIMAMATARSTEGSPILIPPETLM